MTIASSKSVNQCSGIEYVKKFTKQMLKGTLFVGIFKEKRLVETLDSYRDVITICPDEEDFIQNIKIVKNKIEKEVLLDNWVGISDPDTIGAPVGYNLWVVLPQEVFGKYWYKVKTVEFLEKEIRLRLEIVRPYKKESTPLRNISASDSGNISAILEEKKLQFKENLVYFFKEMLTLQNIKEVVTFIAVLFTAALAAIFSGTQYLLEYSLKLIRELSGFVKAVTPLLVNITNLVGRTIFGILHLIYALFQSKPKPGPVYNNYLTIDPNFADPRARYNKYFDKNVPYFPPIGGTPKITPIMD